MPNQMLTSSQLGAAGWAMSRWMWTSSQLGEAGSTLWRWGPVFSQGAWLGGGGGAPRWWWIGCGPTVGAGAFILRVGGFLRYLAVVNLPWPALDFVLAQQDLAGQIAPEKLEFQPGSAAWGAPQVANLLEESLWVVLEVNEHTCQVGRQLVERHGAVDMALLTLGAPDDAFIRHLIYDLRRPGAM